MRKYGGDDRYLRAQERERAAALVRAYSETRPAGEVPPLLALAHTIETGQRTAPEPREPVCAKCGQPRSDHPYRHPFQSRDHDAR